MAFIGITAGPYRPSSGAKPSFCLDTGELFGDAVQLQCSAKQILAQLATEFRGVETFCGPADQIPVEGTRSYDVEAWLSYGDGAATNPFGLYTVLAQKELQKVGFAACPNGDAPVSPTNPEISGEVWVPPLPAFNAPNPTDPVSITFTLQVYQAVTVADSPAAAVMTHPLGPLT